MVNLSNIDKIVFIAYIPLTEKIYYDFFFPTFFELGKELLWCDISGIFHYKGNRSFQSDYVQRKVVSTYKELNRFLNAETTLHTLFFPLVTANGNSIRLYRTLTKNRCNVASFCMDMVPTFSFHEKMSKLSQFSYLLKSIKTNEGRKRMLEFVNNIVLKQMKDFDIIKGVDVIFRAGLRGSDAIGIVGEKEIERAYVVDINSPTYETARRALMKPYKTLDSYILFIDQYYPLHPDGYAIGLPPLSAERYYKGLNSYFDRMEEKYGVPIIIAAHPKADRYKTEDYFNGREIIFGQSAELSVNALFILTHTSTAIAYAIALGKRLHLLTFEELEEKRVYTHDYIKSLAKVVGCNYQKFDDNSAINVIDEINQECYYHYKMNYLTSPETEYLHSTDIIKNAFAGNEI